MSADLRTRIFDALDAIVLVDPHTHINAHAPASTTLADILGYHYYTELAHSAGMPQGADRRAGPRSQGESRPAGRVPGRAGEHDPVELADRNGARRFSVSRTTRSRAANWEALYDRAAAAMAQPDWTAQVLKQSKLEAVFLTNDFDDPLDGLRHGGLRSLPADRRPGVSPGASRRCDSGWRRRPAASVHDARSLRPAIGKLFEHFVARGARACAISLPPDFSPQPVDARRRRDGRRRGAGDLGQQADAERRARTEPLRLLDAGRVLRRVQAAVRSDDRRQSRRLRATAFIRATTCTTAASR